MKSPYSRQIIASAKFILFAVLSAIFMEHSAKGQDPPPLRKDTTIMKTIPLEKIPVSFGEAVIKVASIKKSVITEGKLAWLKADNDQLMIKIDSSLEQQINIDLVSLNNRYLRNMQNYWIDYRIQIQKAKTALSAHVRSLSEKQTALTDMLRL